MFSHGDENDGIKDENSFHGAGPAECEVQGRLEDRLVCAIRLKDENLKEFVLGLKVYSSLFFFFSFFTKIHFWSLNVKDIKF